MSVRRYGAGGCGKPGGWSPLADTSDFRTGFTMRHKNGLWTIADFQHVKPLNRIAKYLTGSDSAGMAKHHHTPGVGVKNHRKMST